MERQKARHSSPAYPTCEAFAPRAALAAALAAAPLATGCGIIDHNDGLIVDPSETWGVSLPEKGSHTTIFPDDQGELDYHLSVEVYPILVDCLELEPELRLAEADAVLQTWPIATFAEEGDLSEVETALAEALAGACGESVSNVQDLALYVDDVREAEEPDTGD